LKGEIVLAAANLAASVMANLPDDLPVDAEIVNDSTKAENLMAFRLTHVFYDGLCRALDPANPQRWQTPAWLEKETVGPGGDLAKTILGALGGTGVEALQKLVAQMFKTSAPASPGGPVPSLLDVVGGAPGAAK
jgi:hypothetical protein